MLITNDSPNTQSTLIVTVLTQSLTPRVLPFCKHNHTHANSSNLSYCSFLIKMGRFIGTESKRQRKDERGEIQNECKEGAHWSGMPSGLITRRPIPIDRVWSVRDCFWSRRMTPTYQTYTANCHLSRMSFRLFPFTLRSPSTSTPRWTAPIVIWTKWFCLSCYSSRIGFPNVPRE